MLTYKNKYLEKRIKGFKGEKGKNRSISLLRCYLSANEKGRGGQKNGGATRFGLPHLANRRSQRPHSYRNNDSKVVISLYLPNISVPCRF